MRVLTDLQYMVLKRDALGGPIVRVPHGHIEGIAAGQCVKLGYYTESHYLDGDLPIRRWTITPSGKLAVRCHEALMKSISGMGG